MEMSWIGFDLDGTLAEHYWPHEGAYHPYHIGRPIPHVVGLAKGFLERGNEVRIFTARVGPIDVGYPQDLEIVRQVIRRWTKEHIGTALEATATKDYKMTMLFDDRAVRITQYGKPCCDGWIYGDAP